MNNSITSISSGAESSGVRVWKAIGSQSTKSYTISAKMKDPLKNCSFRGEEVRAVFGFTKYHGQFHLIYFWSRDIIRLRWNVESGEARLLANDAEKLITSFNDLNKYCDDCPSLAEFIQLEGVSDNNVSYACFGEEMELYWRHETEIFFVALYKRKTENHLSSHGLSECLSFHEDYFRLKHPNWRTTPIRFLMERCAHDVSKICAVHLQPKCFNPMQNRQPSGAFLWPWQKSIARNQKTNTFQLEPITTTSLYLDLRKSTVTMEQFGRGEKGLFSEFIDKIIEGATEITFEYGGFFDKETGDGLVAHFVDFEYIDGDRIPAPEKRAFAASQVILEMIQAAFEKYQKNLDFGVGAFGGAIGLHTGESTWVIDEDRVRAIGDSVIIAARLCASSGPGEIFVSNRFYHALDEVVLNELERKFIRKNFSSKEYREDASLFGYKLDLLDICQNGIS